MDDVTSRYPGDTTITSYIDPMDNMEFVHTNSFPIGLNNTCTRIKMSIYQDYGIGLQQAQVTFTLYGSNNSNITAYQVFTNVNSNAYTGCHTLVSSKYLFWYFCDQNGLTITT